MQSNVNTVLGAELEYGTAFKYNRVFKMGFETTPGSSSESDYKYNMVRLTEDEVDDFVYMARVNEVEDFAQMLSQYVYPARKVTSKVVAQADTAVPADAQDDEAAETPAASDAKPYVSALDVLEAVVDDSRNTPLHMAAGNGHWDIVAFLLQLIRRTPAVDPSAASPPTPEAYEVRRKAFVDASNSHGNTALHWAALNGHLKVVQLLIEYGSASPLEVNDKDLMPLELAMLNNQERVIKYLMDKAEAGSAEAEAKEKAAAEKEAAAKKEAETETETKLSSATEELTLEEAKEEAA
ncbi:ankyrin repeat containing protein yar1 [Ophiostoma piceae UAMH 11346]|uniref:Ankyrin repeat containing protein yar1 n=1 Tax=Ophiostoma piceae (strain UAMH 11346) TaxID=1262450 RepID=S3D6U8_OPHP1|nr:ankyrin repeat containing protein yar1 [Ophiostoma piceae UAMH 11346]